MADPVQTYNDDIAGLYARINRFIVEVIKSLSANVADFGDFDTKRLRSYLDALVIYLDWVVGEPQMDYPETHPKVLVLPEPPVIPEIENPQVEDIVRLFVRLRDELIHSQSSRLPSGLVEFDNVRARRTVERAGRYLEDYIVQVSPVDLPESSPKAAMTGPGRPGV